MATYVYEVVGTDEVFEVKQSMNEDALTEHPERPGVEVRRLIPGSQGGFRIGGGHNSTSMWNVSGDPGPRRKGYDCDPMN